MQLNLPRVLLSWYSFQIMQLVACRQLEKGRKVFGLFKKKAPPAPPPRQISVNENLLDKSAAILDMQLMICRNQPGYLSKLDSNYVRGYFIGYFDCTLQKLGRPVDSDEEFVMLLLRGHGVLLCDDIGNTQSYTFASLRLQGDPQFAQGQADGGNDCDDSLKNDRKPLTLMRYFMEG